MRLPAYVNMEHTPYDPVLYRAGLDPVPDEEEINAKRARMISVRNTIRWKWATGDDGEPVRRVAPPAIGPRRLTCVETPEQLALASLVGRLGFTTARGRFVRPRPVLWRHTRACFRPTTQKPTARETARSKHYLPRYCVRRGRSVDDGECDRWTLVTGPRFVE